MVEASKIETTKEAKPYPPQRAVAAAVEMEIHCAIGSKTIDKAHDIDDRFPAYDDMFAALKAVQDWDELEANPAGYGGLRKDIRKIVDAALSKALEPRI